MRERTFIEWLVFLRRCRHAVYIHETLSLVKDFSHTDLYKQLEQKLIKETHEFYN